MGIKLNDIPRSVDRFILLSNPKDYINIFREDECVTITNSKTRLSFNISYNDIRINESIEIMELKFNYVVDSTVAILKNKFPNNYIERGIS